MEKKALPTVSQDLRDSGNNQPDTEVPNGTQRNRSPKGSHDNPQTKVRANGWPFKFTLADNRWFVNRARKKRLSLDDEALL